MNSKISHQKEFFLEYEGVKHFRLLDVEEVVKASASCKAFLSSGSKRWLTTTSFWYDNWSQLGVLINLTGERGCIALGIPIHATVERVVQIPIEGVGIEPRY